MEQIKSEWDRVELCFPITVPSSLQNSLERWKVYFPEELISALEERLELMESPQKLWEEIP